MFLLIGVVFVGVGVLLLVLAMKAKVKAGAATKWPTTPGRIIHSVITESESWDSDQNRYVRRQHANIAYQYQVGNMTYTCDNFGIGTSPGSPQVCVSQHPVGRTLPVHFNPQNPAQATLYIGQSQGCLLVGMGIAFLALGGICTLVGLAAAMR